MLCLSDIKRMQDGPDSFRLSWEVADLIHRALSDFVGDIRLLNQLRLFPDFHYRLDNPSRWSYFWAEVGRTSIYGVKLSTLLNESGFFDHLHALFTLWGECHNFPDTHPYSQPHINIPQLRVGELWRVAELIQLLERWRANGSEHPLAMGAALSKCKNISEAEMRTRCFKDLSWVAVRVRDMEGRGGRIVRHHTQKGRDKHPTLTGLDRVDWGDGKRWKSVRHNLEPYLQEFLPQVNDLTLEVPPTTQLLPVNSPALQEVYAVAKDVVALSECFGDKYLTTDDKYRRFHKLYTTPRQDFDSLRVEYASLVREKEAEVVTLEAQIKDIQSQLREKSQELYRLKNKAKSDLWGGKS